MRIEIKSCEIFQKDVFIEEPFLETSQGNERL
jgi:hypothetical protein